MKSQKFTNLIWLFSFTVSRSAVDSFILKTGFEYKAAYVLNVFKLVLNTIRLSKVDCVQKTYLFFTNIQENTSKLTICIKRKLDRTC